MGSNLKEESLTRAARSVTSLAAMTETFDKQTGVPGVPTAHHTRSQKEDVLRVVSILQAEEVLLVKPG